MPGSKGGLMFLKRSLIGIWIVSAVTAYNLTAQKMIQGVVTDNGYEPVRNALVEIIDKNDPARVFSMRTNKQGEYFIEILETEVEDRPGQMPVLPRLAQNYPNPFNPSTSIFYELHQPENIHIEIFDVMGRKIKTLFRGFHVAQNGFIVWDATDDQGRGVPAGLYICLLRAGDTRVSRKMLLLDGRRAGMAKPLSEKRGGTSASTLLNGNGATLYLMRITGEDIQTWEHADLQIEQNMILNVSVIRTVTDVDGNIYLTVKIGDQWWMAENLRTTRYRNGDPITLETDSTAWGENQTEAYCYYDNDSATADPYGCYYNGWAVEDARGIAPEGWHVPTDEEWKRLEMFLDMSRSEADKEGYRGTDEGGKLKSTGTSHWLWPNKGAANASGFTALPGGHRDYHGDFNDVRMHANFWTSTKNDHRLLSRLLHYEYSTIQRRTRNLHNGFSIRCVRD